MKEIKRDASKSADNLIDRAINAIAPQIGVRRRQARLQLAVSDGLMSGYIGARKNRRALKNWAMPAGSADGDTLPDLPILRERSRDLVRNEPIASGAINTKVTNVVGGGLIPTPNIDREFLGLSEEEAADWHAAAIREWKLFAQTSDMTGEGDFYEQQDLAFRSVLEGGDCFAVKRFEEIPGETYGLKIQLVEADRCSNPKNVADKPGKLAGGVERDARGRAEFYHFTKRHPGDVQDRDARKWDKIPAFDEDGGRLVLHLFQRLRIDQSRGVPDLAAVIEPFKQLGRYTEAEITAAVVSAMFTVFVETEGGQGMAPSAPDGTASSDPNEIKMGAGAVIDLGPNEKVEFANPSRPNANFDPFTMAVYKHIGVGLNLPADVLLKAFNSSYSASRAALDTAWQYFKNRRTWLEKKFCNPPYGWLLDEAIARGRLIAPGYFDDPLIRAAYARVIWNGPGRIHIDPTKEAKADKMYVDMGVKSLTEVTRERTGADWEERHEERMREVKKRRDAGLEVELQPASPAGFLVEEEEKPDEKSD